MTEREPPSQFLVLQSTSSVRLILCRYFVAGLVASDRSRECGVRRIFMFLIPEKGNAAVPRLYHSRRPRVIRKGWRGKKVLQ